MSLPGSSPLKPFLPSIKVVGVGGGGGNVIARMLNADVAGVHLVACNTDLQALRNTGAPSQVLLGKTTTGGRGAGTDAELGRRGATESEGEIRSVLAGAEMVFIAAGLGGGTGTGASPVIAEQARNAGTLTVGVVTLPFSFEGKRRMATALKGLEALRRVANVVLVIPNDRLVTYFPRTTSMLKAFEMADHVLMDVIQGISDLVTHNGLINVDLSDVRTVMENRGNAVIGRGTGEGEDRLLQATRQALHNPLMGDVDIRGAKGILAHVMGNENLGLVEVQEAMDLINRQAGEQANVIFGATTRQEMGNGVSIIVIITGLAYEQTVA